MSLICGSCRERGKARLDTASEFGSERIGFVGEREYMGTRVWCEYRRGALWRTGS